MHLLTIRRAGEIILFPETDELAPLVREKAIGVISSYYDSYDQI